MRFSVIVPNYNNGKYLKRCLDSILNQTFKDFEIFFIDDRSTDGSLQTAMDIIGDKQPTTFIKNTTKRLNGGSRNVGIVESDSDYTICIDSDDFFKDNNVFEDINNALKYNPDVLFLGYDTYFGNSSIPYVPTHTNLTEALEHCVCAIWTKVVKTDILKDTPFPEGTLYEDRIHHYKLLEKCKTFANLERTCILWDRTNSNSVSQSKDYTKWEFCYAGLLYDHIRNTKRDDLKPYYIQELKGYMKHINEMAGEIIE